MNTTLLFYIGPTGPVFFAIYFFFPLVLLFLFFFYRYFKHKERMALVERNKDIWVPSFNKSRLLVAGSVFIALGLGVLASILVAPLFPFRQEKFAPIILVPFFVGVALLACYFYFTRQDRGRPRE